MAVVKATFHFTCDNQQLALDETETRITSLGLTVEKINIIDSHPVEKSDPDWFDDRLFTICAAITSSEQIKTSTEIQQGTMISSSPAETVPTKGKLT